MITRKTISALAEALRESPRTIGDCVEAKVPCVNSNMPKLLELQHQKVCARVAAVLAGSAGFNAKRFADECGLKKEVA